MDSIRRLFRRKSNAESLLESPKVQRDIAAIKRLREQGKLEECAQWCEANLRGWSRD